MSDEFAWAMELGNKRVERARRVYIAMGYVWGIEETVSLNTGHRYHGVLKASEFSEWFADTEEGQAFRVGHVRNAWKQWASKNIDADLLPGAVKT